MICSELAVLCIFSFAHLKKQRMINLKCCVYIISKPMNLYIINAFLYIISNLHDCHISLVNTRAHLVKQPKLLKLYQIVDVTTKV